MKTKMTLALGSIIFGLLSGNNVLIAVRFAHPQTDWSSIQFIFLCSILGMIFVIGMQILRSNPKYGYLAIVNMLIISLYIAASGVSALIISGVTTPASTLVLVAGLGSIIGVGLSFLLYQWRHASIQ